jgi:hypothetical protein
VSVKVDCAFVAAPVALGAAPAGGTVICTGRIWLAAPGVRSWSIECDETDADVTALMAQIAGHEATRDVLAQRFGFATYGDLFDSLRPSFSEPEANDVEFGGQVERRMIAWRVTH